MNNVIYNQGAQEIRSTPIHPMTGSPVVVDSGTDVTCQIVDLRESEASDNRVVLATATVAQDSFSAALTGAAGFSQADPTSLPIDATSADVGRSYLLTASDGTSELVQLASIGSASASTMTPLRGNYVTSDTLSGVDLVATFPLDEANDEDSVEDRGGPYLVTWTYVVDGATVVLPSTLYVDRFSTAPPIDETFVLKALPSMATRARGRASVASAISVAWEDWLAELQSSGKDPSLFPPGLNVRVAVRNMAIAYLLQWVGSGEDDNTDAVAKEARAREMFADILTGRTPKGQEEVTRDSFVRIAQPKGHQLFRLS